MSALRVSGLTVRYGFGHRAHTAVDGVDFEIPAGGVLGLVGESGSGKSTIARAVLGLAPIAAGDIEIDGRSLRSMSAKDRARRVQMIFQDPFGSLNPRMTVGEIVREALAVRSALRPAERAAEVARLLDVVSLPPDLASRPPGRLSGGQRQRVAIARALAARPDVIVADEITSALDVSVQAQVLNVLRETLLRERLTMLFISHNLAVVRYVSDRIAVMRGGVIVESGDTDDVLDRPQHPYTRTLLESIPTLDRAPGRGTPGG